MLLCEQVELASQRREAAGLDLDQQVAADEVDDETVDDLLDAVAAASVPVLELSVKRALVERPDRRRLGVGEASISRTECTMNSFSAAATSPSSDRDEEATALSPLQRVIFVGRAYERGEAVHGRPPLTFELHLRVYRFLFDAWPASSSAAPIAVRGRLRRSLRRPRGLSAAARRFAAERSDEQPLARVKSNDPQPVIVDARRSSRVQV